MYHRRFNQVTGFHVLAKYDKRTLHVLQGHGTLVMEDMESPFVVFGKNVKSGYLIEEPVVQYDIAATIAYILGLETPSAWRGKPVLGVFEQ